MPVDSEATFCCNRCHQRLTTTLFACACDCIFCEECTYAHFGSSDECPSCGKKLRPSDFLELVVSDPSVTSQETMKTTFQNLFTKMSPGSNIVSRRDMVARGLRAMDDGRRAMRFLLNQFLKDCNAEGQRSGEINRINEKLHAENERLKQAMNSQRISYERKIADLESKIKSQAEQIKQLQYSSRERDSRPAQVPHLVSADSNHALLSSRSSGSGGRRGRYSPAIMAPGQNAATPPIAGLIRQPRSLEKENRNSLKMVSQVPLHSHGNNVQRSVLGITPIQNQRPASTVAIGSRHYQQPLSARQTGVGPMPGTPRIRDFSSQGYRFSSSTNGGRFSVNGNKRPRTSSFSSFQSSSLGRR